MSKLIDWHSHPLTHSTVLDKGYKSTQNVRRFFKKELGDDFHFNVAFMQFLKTHAGITLQDAHDAWKTTYKKK